ncbi:hypothetical protein SAMD00019534_067510, partial [Acytostelium subglobosum LB1]|uniref:hypothetical protein n=1 Tax=Acytostelium subglobosum LB1 TaxID=1410327 RepID=UPI000644DCE8
MIILLYQTLWLERMLSSLLLSQLLILLVGLDTLFVSFGVQLLHEQILHDKDGLGTLDKHLGLALLKLVGGDVLGGAHQLVDKLGDRAGWRVKHLAKAIQEHVLVVAVGIAGTLHLDVL